MGFFRDECRCPLPAGRWPLAAGRSPPARYRSVCAPVWGCVRARREAMLAVREFLRLHRAHLLIL